jgi:hypothetical protein
LYNDCASVDGGVRRVGYRGSEPSKKGRAEAHGHFQGHNAGAAAQVKAVLDTSVFVSGVLFSGDKHLLVKSGYGDVHVLKPREFVEKILP